MPTSPRTCCLLWAYEHPDDARPPCALAAAYQKLAR